MKKLFVSIKQWSLLGFLFFLFCAFYFFDFHHYFTFENIKVYQHLAEQWTIGHYKLTVLAYSVLFTTLVACGIPFGTLLTVFGGFIFGFPALLYATFCTTVGGTILFLAARSSIGAHLAVKPEGWIKKMGLGFQQNAFNYLFMLRVVPIFPCGVINLAAGALNTSLKTYALATTLGTLPANFIYVMIGRGLDTFFSESTPHYECLLQPGIIWPVMGLGLLCFLPLLYTGLQSFKRRKRFQT